MRIDFYLVRDLVCTSSVLFTAQLLFVQTAYMYRIKEYPVKWVWEIPFANEYLRKVAPEVTFCIQLYRTRISVSYLKRLFVVCSVTETPCLWNKESPFFKKQKYEKCCTARAIRQTRSVISLAEP